MSRFAQKEYQSDPFKALGYTPTPKQWELHLSTEDEVLYGGAAGGGKTRALLMEGIAKAIAYPGLRIGAFRRTYDELAESLIKELGRIQFARLLGCEWNATDHVLRFPNGSVIRFRYAESLVDATRRQGGEYQLILIDELTLMHPAAVDALKERIRSGDVNQPVIGLRATSNPGGLSHGQAKARYITATNYGASVFTDPQGLTVRFIPARVQDNPYVDPAYVRRLAAIPDPARRKAMLDGSWDVFSGQFFTEWNYDRHVMEPFDLPASWRRYAGIDWGYAAPWCVVWLAEDEDGRLYAYRELYEKEVGEHEQARRVVAYQAVDGETHTVCDPAMVAKRGDADSITTSYEQEGLFVEPANNDRMAGWARFHSYLGEAPACAHHRALGWETCPKIHVFSPCANGIRTIPDLPYSSTKVEDLDTHADDHWVDAARYAMMSIGEGPQLYFPDEVEQPVPVMGPYAVKTDQLPPWMS